MGGRGGYYSPNRKPLPIFLKAVTHPVFVVSHVAQDVVQVEDAAVAVLQPVNLQPVGGVLKHKRRSGGFKNKTIKHPLR